MAWGRSEIVKWRRHYGQDMMYRKRYSRKYAAFLHVIILYNVKEKQGGHVN
jgi:hypothetical protein